jgi:hypothetical protein
LRTYDDKLKNIKDWVEITNHHWHRLKGQIYNDTEFWDHTLHAMTNDDWWDWVDIAPALKIQYEREWRRYPKMDISTDQIKRTLMLSRTVTKRSRKGTNFEAFRLLMNIKDFVNDLEGTPTKRYELEPEVELPRPVDTLFEFKE